jgi:hypothetical protein
MRQEHSNEHSDGEKDEGEGEENGSESGYGAAAAVMEGYEVPSPHTFNNNNRSDSLGRVSSQEARMDPNSSSFEGEPRTGSGGGGAGKSDFHSAIGSSFAFAGEQSLPKNIGIAEKFSFNRTFETHFLMGCEN